MNEVVRSPFDIKDYLRLQLMPHFMCPGCGHGIALRALLWAVHELGLDKNKLAVVSGIGCSGRVGAYIDANTYHTTHGRPLAFATGLKLARPDLNVVVITGDGDCLAIGGNHLIHACRRNLDLTCLMLNNEIYGMTGGQVSPTTSIDRVTTTTPHGNAEPTFDACTLAEAAGASFVGREVTRQAPALKNLIKAAIAHQGFSFVEAMSDCTEIYGRKNDLGESPEMILSQKSDMRPEAHGETGRRAVPAPSPAHRNPRRARSARIRTRLSPARGDRPRQGKDDEREPGRNPPRRQRRPGPHHRHAHSLPRARAGGQARRAVAKLRADFARRFLLLGPGRLRRRRGLSAGDEARYGSPRFRRSASTARWRSSSRARWSSSMNGSFPTRPGAASICMSCRSASARSLQAVRASPTSSRSARSRACRACAPSTPWSRRCGWRRRRNSPASISPRYAKVSRSRRRRPRFNADAKLDLFIPFATRRPRRTLVTSNGRRGAPRCCCNSSATGDSAVG